MTHDPGETDPRSLLAAMGEDLRAVDQLARTIIDGADDAEVVRLAWLIRERVVMIEEHREKLLAPAPDWAEQFQEAFERARGKDQGGAD